MVARAVHPHDFFSPDEKAKIVQAIRAAEDRTTGEIRIHLERGGRGHLMDRTKRIFQQHRMHRRPHRNAVLIHLSLASRSFAIVGDEGIHQRVGEAFWGEVAQAMQRRFAHGQFVEGLEYAIHEIGVMLKRHFMGGDQCVGRS